MIKFGCVLWRPVCVLLTFFASAKLVPVLEYDIWSENNDVHLKTMTTRVKDGNFSEDGRNPKVLNFIPIPVEEECLSTDGRRKGVCMNTYECRIQGGSSHGFCAMGFGVCCVFTATCDQDIFNNLTYFVNPRFPDLDLGMSGCNLKLKKIDEEISQIRLDFVHFNLGQPNRKTGNCEDDVLIISGGSSKDLSLCGYNSGQHVYFDVENMEEPISITMNLSKKTARRFWEIRVSQIPFSQRAPIGCLQYHTGKTGVVQTMNFAENGRHLANQDYNICMRQERGMCSIAYEPCDENSFRIASNAIAESNQVQTVTSPPSATTPTPELNDVEGSGDPIAVESRSIEVCADKIVMPCNSDDIIMPGELPPEFCTIARCGSSLCPNGESPCRLESSVTPFSIGVHFGPSSRDNSSPDDNLGMCLVYQQMLCVV